MNTEKSPVIFIPHGGGPLPLLGEKSHYRLISFLQTLANTFKKPDAILVISAHWEETQPTLTCAQNNTLIYDYYGFPEASYKIQYAAAGLPEMTKKIQQLLQENKFNAQLDEKRGLDHGVFVPLKLIYPQADIPCIQLSLINNLDAAEHIQLGQALSTLRNENILILGSGFSFHNLPALMSPNKTDHDEKNQAFEDWLIDTCCNPALSETERKDKLTHWQQAPFARYAHPREEHLLPLHICYGMANSPAELIFSDNVLGKKTCAFRW